MDKGRLRVLFKDALRGFLPDATITKSKHGFGLPVRDLAAGPCTAQGADACAIDSLGRRGMVRPDYLALLRREHASGHSSYYGVMIWVLVELQLWLRANT